MMLDYRVKLLRLLAEIDQQIRESDLRMADGSASEHERHVASAWSSFRRRARARIEAMLSKLSNVR
jgi:hypothetical protein